MGIKKKSRTLEFPKTCKSFTVDAFGGARVTVIDSRKKFYKWIEDNELENLDFADDWDTCNGSAIALHSRERVDYVITLKSNTLKVIVHECVHIAHFILENKGIPNDHQNSEVMAYLTDYIFGEVCKIAKPKRLDKETN